MVGRREFGIASMSAIALAGLGRVVAAQEVGKRADDEKAHLEHSDALQACAKACSDCQRACDMCSTHCAHLLQGGQKEHMATLGTCQDCADFCVAAAQIVSRGGPFTALICKGCADACANCAEQCEKFPDDKHMKMCAEECRRCEKVCKEMAGHAGHENRR